MKIEFKTVVSKVRAFLQAQKGNVAMIFALSMVPLTLAAGVGMDFTRAMLVRQQMAGALDAAALAVGSSTGLDQTAAQALAQKYFNANYTIDTTAFGTPTVTIPTSGYNSGGSVLLTATAPMPTILMKLAGITTIPVSTSTTVVWGQSKLWVALVLDNSGSMAQGDSSGSKMSALQNASHQLLTILQNASSTAGDVQVSISPFVHLVNVGTSNVNAAWIDWSDWNSPPIVDQTNYVYQKDTDTFLNNDPLNTFGPGDSCPYDGTAGYKCAPTSVNDTHCYTGSGGDDCISTIPSSGTYKGYICPSMHIGGTQDGLGYHFYNGCWTGTTPGLLPAIIRLAAPRACSGHSASNCSCTGSGSGKSVQDQDMDIIRGWRTITALGPVASWTANRIMISPTLPPPPANTLFPAANNVYCGPATVTPLGYNWTNLGTQVDAMTPYGATNQAIGMAHGWQTLTPGNPYGAPTVPSNTSRYMIILSDGLNTMDRWWGDGSTENTTADGNIDAREKAPVTQLRRKAS